MEHAEEHLMIHLFILTTSGKFLIMVYPLGPLGGPTEMPSLKKAMLLNCRVSPITIRMSPIEVISNKQILCLPSAIPPLD